MVDLDPKQHQIPRRRSSPFPHFEFSEGALLSTREVDELVASFPEHLLPDSEHPRRGSDKDYVVQHLVVFIRGAEVLDLEQLAPAWRRFVRDACSADYVQWMSSVLDLPPVSAENVELRLTSYPSGGWMSRHTDRSDKAFSQVIYLCPGWKRSWGGGLALYDGPDDLAPARVVHPSAGNSVAFARSERSWHEVLRVTPQAPCPRRAVLIHGYRG